MKLGKIILAFAIAMALFIGILTTTITTHHQGVKDNDKPKPSLEPPGKRTMSRFLAGKERNPRAADHCNKDNSVCTANGKNETCCNNKCIDLKYNNDNCGVCKKKCLYTQTCCRGECVYLAFDARHCNECNFRCKENQYCVYGMCNYA